MACLGRFDCYAKLLARIQCWPNTIHESDEPVYAEKMLKYLPPDPNQYYEMGNARLEIGFRDSVVGDALYRLARHRLRHGRVEEARESLNRYVQVLPSFVKTNLTPERIASMKTLEELDRPAHEADNVGP
jgi:ribosomal protein L16/L10AE